MRKENLLVEIGTEELPPKALKKLATAFSDALALGLKDAKLSFSSAHWYASPRRLAVKVDELVSQQEDKVIEKRGPAVAAAFDQAGVPTKAAEGWARANGISVSEAQRLKTDKGEWLLHKAHVAGKGIESLLADIVATALKKLPIPKPMRWGSTATQFIRPVHTFTLLYGSDVIAGEVLGASSSNRLLGHRFHSQGEIRLNHADAYLPTLEEHFVVADHAARKQMIQTQLMQAASVESAKVEIDPDLLEEVTALVEWPVVLSASFDAGFLDVPKEALIYTMQDDQKYFPLLSEHGALLPRFLFVSNIQSKDPSQVIAGNEKVIRPRLADAKFFFETDKKHSLESRIKSLETVLFQKQLGTLADKSQRIATLAGMIASKLGADPTLAARAGLLSKADLTTNMVMEFPDVQGVMGMHYARHDGEHPEVALALDEQYKPRFAGDQLPTSAISCAVALADKLDTLVGIFGIGQLPKGDKDPFALRRAAIGVLRIIVENKLDLELSELIGQAQALFADKLSNADTAEQVLDFTLARFRTWYQEQGVDIDVIQAVEARRPTRPSDFAARIHGVTEFKKLASAKALASANKRVANILNKNDVSDSADMDMSLLVEAQEIALAKQIKDIEGQVTPLLATGDHVQVLNSLAQLRENVDAFFDNVMVMADDQAVKQNRLALLFKLRQLFLRTADISLLNQ